MFLGAGTPSVTYDYGYGRTYDTTKTYYQQTPSTATYQAAAQPYAETAAQPTAKVSNDTCKDTSLSIHNAELIKWSLW